MQPVASTSAVRPLAKRHARACLVCRKAKKPCDGGDEPPCLRCRQSGSECVFERPASRIIDDAGLERLSGIESHLASHDRRIDSLLETMGEVKALLAEVLGSRSSPHGRPLGLESALSISPGSIPTHNPLPPPPMPVHRVSQPFTTFSDMPPTSHWGSSSSSVPAPPPQPAARTFESNMHASAEAVKNADVERFPDPASAGTFAPEELVENGGPRKRRRTESHATTLATAATATDQDVVSKGMLSDQQGRAMHLLFMKEMAPFCSVLEKQGDTYLSVKRKSAFLCNTIIYSALRCQGGREAPSEELKKVEGEVNRMLRILAFNQTVAIETLQAVAILCWWAENPYLLSGYAMRMALSARLDTIFEQLDAHQWTSADEKALGLVTKLRVWLSILWVEFRNSRSTGRLILLQDCDAARIQACADRLLMCPLATEDDNRTVAVVQLALIERKIVEETNRMGTTTTVEDKATYVHQMRQVLVNWYSKYDLHHAHLHPSPQSWARVALRRHLEDASLFLSCAAFKHELLERNVPPATAQIAKQALLDARHRIASVTEAPAFGQSTRFSSYLMRVDLTFACLLAYKIGALYRDTVTPDDLLSHIPKIAEMLADCAGSTRYSTILKLARENFLTCISPAAHEAPIQPYSMTASNYLQAEESILFPQESEIDWATVLAGYTAPIMPGPVMAHDPFGWMDILET